MKVIRIIGIIDAIVLLIVGVLYFCGIRFSGFILPILLSVLIITVCIQINKNSKNN